MGRRVCTHEDFVKKVGDLVGDDYEVVTSYQKSSIPVIMKHVECGHSWSVRPNSFISANSRCPKCFPGGKNKIKSDEFQEKIFQSGGDYVILGEYVNAITKIKVKHIKCGEISFKNPRSILENRDCEHCAQSKKKTTEDVRMIVEKCGEYKLVSKYKGAHNKITVRHRTCAKMFAVTYSNFANAGTRCPYCFESKGEKSLRNWLDTHGIAYVPQYKLVYDQNKPPLRVDFMIFEGMYVAIEYDGEQHFKPIKHFGGKRGLQDTQRRDKIKDKYCADNGIPLIRIPYWEYDNIGAILTEKLLPLLTEPNAKLTIKAS